MRYPARRIFTALELLQSSQPNPCAASRTAQAALLHQDAMPGAAAPPGRNSMPGSVFVAFCVHMHCDYGQQVCLVGSDPALGSWDTSLAVPLQWSEGDWWQAWVELPAG